LDPVRRVIHPALIVKLDALNGCYKVTEVERKVPEEGALEH